MQIKEVIPIASTTIFVLAAVFNSFFVYLVCTKTHAQVGTYKYLMISFGICNILYSFSEFISQPAVHIYGHSYMSYSNGFLAHLTPWGFLSMCSFITMYGMNTALLTLHFLYRYVVVCRPNSLKSFTRPYIAFWSIPVVAWGLLYGFITAYCFAGGEDFNLYAEKSVHESLGQNVRNMSFFCIFVCEKEGDSFKIYWRDTIGLLVIVLMMVVTFGIMVVCGIKTKRKLQSITLSKRSLLMQKQLLRALTTQAVIPFFLSYMPRYMLFFFVVFGLPPLKIYAFVPVVITIYTVLDPIAIILFINDYRNAAKKMATRPMGLIFNKITTTENSVSMY